MPLPAGYFQHTIRMTNAGAEGECAIVIATGDLIGAGDPAELVYTAFGDSFLTLMQNNWNLVGVDSRNDLGVIEYAQVTAASGGSGAAVGVQSAVLVRKVTGLGGRENRGRMYVPAPPASVLDYGSILPATPQGNWQAQADEFLDALIASFSQGMVIEHSDGGTPTEVTSLAVQSRLATQRGRIRD